MAESELDIILLAACNNVSARFYLVDKVSQLIPPPQYLISLTPIPMGLSL